MPRVFTANYQTASASKAAKPYLVLGIQWNVGGIKYYVDRENTFDAAGTRLPTIETPRVLEWGNVAIEMKEQQIGGVDSLTVKIDDSSRTITALLNGNNQQTSNVYIYGMFDTSTVVWPTDAALLFQGVLKPGAWQQQDNSVTLTFDTWSQALRVVGDAASNTIFTQIPQEYRDRTLPIVFGQAYRVPAVCVQRPWIMHTTQAIPGTASAATVNLDQHPDDLGITSGINYDVFINGDAFTVTFQQSATPDTVPSTMTIPGTNPYVQIAFAGTGYAHGSPPVGVILPDCITPVSMRDILENYVGVGTVVLPWSNNLGGVWLDQTTVSYFVKGGTWPKCYDVKCTALTYLSVPYDMSYISGLKFLDAAATRKAYPAGATITPKNATSIYVANDLPSKSVNYIEGWGSCQDFAGNGRKDFKIIGGVLNDVTVGSTTTSNTSTPLYTVNLNDSTWAATLGHNCTTINFGGTPRTIDPLLDDDRIWVTLQGIDDARNSSGSLITNPVLTLLEYLENPNLLGVGAGSINLTAFSAAAADSSISGRRVGFAQLESSPGLTFLQEIARQAHCILFFDQSQVSIAVLQNSAIASSLTFDCTTNDNIKMGTLVEEETPVDQVLTRINGKWRQFWDDINGNKLVDIVSENTAASTAILRRDQDMEIWLYGKRSDAEDEITFWKTRLSRIYRNLTFQGFLDAQKILPADWIALTFVEGDGNSRYSAQALEVVKSSIDLKEFVVEIQARLVAHSW